MPLFSGDKIAGDKWSGQLRFDDSTQTDAGGVSQGRGKVAGYSWYLQLKNSAWLVEIAEDQTLSGDDLPLVGYGCGGWLYECEVATLPTNQHDLREYVTQQLSAVFKLFQQNQLNYLPAVSCPCSE